MASEAFQAVSAMMREQLRLSDPELGPDELRAGMDGTAAFPLPEHVEITEVAAGGVPSEWVRVPASRDDAVVMYLHGGGYVIGSPRTHRNLTWRLAEQAEVRVLAVDYRLAPEHPFPAAVDDAVAAYRFLLGSGIDPARIVIAGDSAGGGLTIATLLRLRDDGLPQPAAGAALSPWTDLALTGASMDSEDEGDPMVRRAGLARMAGWYLDGADAREPHASPLYGDLTGLAPLLVHVGEVEVLRDDATRIAEAATAAGVDVELCVFPEMIHVFQVFAGLFPEADEGVAVLAGWIRERVG